MTKQSQVRLHLVVNRHLWMLKVIEQMNFPVDSLGSNNFLVLRHVPRFVYFALVVNLNININPGLLGIGQSCASDSICVVL